MKKVLALILSAVLVMGMLAGCGSTAPAEAKPGENAPAANGEPVETRDINGLTLPISTTGEELTVFYAYNGTAVEDLNEIESVKIMEQNTGVHVNWIPVALAELQEKFNTLINSGDYPDIVMLSFFPTYPGGWEKGIEDGVILNMNDLVLNYMPNYRAALARNDFGNKQAMSDNHEYLIGYSLQGTDTSIEGEGVVCGLGYRADILESLNMDEPTTMEELHDVLVAVKESGVPYPLMISQNGASEFLFGYGLNYTPWTVTSDDKIVYTYTQDGAGKYLETMRQWYAEGLIDPNFTGFNFFMDLPVSVETNANFMYSVCLSFGHDLYNSGRISNPDAFLQPYLPPAITVPESVKSYAQEVTKNPAFITTSCKNPELAAKWLDYLYTDEAAVLMNYGVQGVTFDYDENGLPQFLADNIINNPEGIPGNIYVQKYCFCNSYAGSACGRANNEATRKLSAVFSGGDTFSAQAVELLSSPSVNACMPAGVLLTDEEGYIVNQYETDITTLTNEYMVKYITGATDESFESFVETCYKYHLQEVIDCYQAAYDRFLAR